MFLQRYDGGISAKIQSLFMVEARTSDHKLVGVLCGMQLPGFRGALQTTHARYLVSHAGYYWH